MDEDTGNSPAESGEAHRNSHRQALRHALEVDVRSAVIGAGATAIALTVVFVFLGPGWGSAVAGIVAGWFLIALIVVLLRGGRGRDAARRAFIATFGWGEWM